MAVEAFAAAYSPSVFPTGALRADVPSYSSSSVYDASAPRLTAKASSNRKSSGAGPIATALVAGVATGIACKATKRWRRQARRALPFQFADPLIVDHRLRRPKDSPLEEPICASILSTRSAWRSAVHEIVQEAKYLTARRSHKQWDFAVAFVHGHDEVSVAEIANKLDTGIGTNGALLAVAVDGCSGDLKNQSRGSASNGGCGISLCGIQLPTKMKPRGSISMHHGKPELTEAVPFFLGKKELMEISSLVMQYQSESDLRSFGASVNARAWRKYLGVPETAEINGVMLFQDPLSSNYVKKQVVAGLDLAFPYAVKCGGVASDLIPSRLRMALAGSRGNRRQFAAAPEDAGVAGMILPSKMSLHTIVTPGAMAIGPELQISEADKHVISKINNEPARDLLATMTRQMNDVAQMLIDRSGLLIGLEAPAQINFDNLSRMNSASSKDSAAEAKMPMLQDWVLRSFEEMLSGDSIILRRENLKRIPARVGPQTLRMKLHVQDCTWAQAEETLNFQRYQGTRMMMSQESVPFGGMALTCRRWAQRAQAIGEEEVGCRAIKQALGDLPVAGARVCGEVAPAGITTGGTKQCRTAQHGYSSASCVFSYEP
eukprot:TRINITY_DN122423_c0_g1_i1.p1 TRINITY_DN122423_c0_g1~~TRINITY_DN122423_c0_g1_i1.p1  ORF type:complete len:603 (+),score=119.53 TRINITY_DN122423_c0_g1_i1:119-1927(+)